MINIVLFNVMCVMFMNSNWSDHERFPEQKIPYNIGHIVSGFVCLIALIILFIKLCWYKNREVISLKNQSRFASLIRCMIVVLSFGFLFTGAYINMESTIGKQEDNLNTKE